MALQYWAPVIQLWKRLPQSAEGFTLIFCFIGVHVHARSSLTLHSILLSLDLSPEPGDHRFAGLSQAGVQLIAPTLAGSQVPAVLALGHPGPFSGF